MKGHIRARGQRSWALIIDLGPDETGRRRQKWYSVHGTKRDAQRELTSILNQINKGTHVDPSRLSVEKYLKDWLTTYALTNVDTSTYTRYQGIVLNHLIPALGRHALAKLQPLQIQAYYSEALRQGGVRSKKPLSTTTVLQHHRVLREALQHALRWQMIGRNPADAVEAPRKRSTEMQTLDVPSIGRLLEAAEGTQQYLPVLLGVTTGMRRGEVFALKWDNVDLKTGKLFVRHSLEKSKDGLRFKEPKTPKAKRCIALPAFVIEALKRHKRLQAQHRLAIGPAYCDLGIVCPREDGRPRHPDTFSTAFCILRTKVGLPKLRFHDLRHTHASQLLAEGVHPKVVSERLGHSTINLTLDTYSHVMPGMQEDAARKIDQALRHAVETTKPLTKSS